MKTRLKKYGPWAVVTGASSGIGQATAIALADEGFSLILAARRKACLAKDSESLQSNYGIQVETCACDLISEAGRQALFRFSRKFDVGLLVTAAGFGTSGHFIDSDISIETDMVTLNVISVMQQCHFYANHFRRRGSGAIVLYSSIVAFQGVPHAANYAATKAYIQSFGEALQKELSPMGIDVLISAPGPTHSGFAEIADMKMAKAELPETVARSTVRYLGSTKTDRPGVFSKFLSTSLMTLPRFARVRMMGQIMKGMHHKPPPNAS